MQRITPCLWFDTQAEEAARFYVSIFKNSKIGAISRYGEACPGPAGSVMTVTFQLDGQEVQCGWLKDRYGVSWQIVPKIVGELMKDPDPAKTPRVMAAIMQMKKLSVEGLKRAYEGR